MPANPIATYPSSLPVATATGEVPVSTGAGTTYTAKSDVAFTDVANTFSANQTLLAGNPQLTLNDTAFFNATGEIRLHAGFMYIANINSGNTYLTLGGQSTNGIAFIGTGEDARDGALAVAWICPGVGTQLTAAATITLTAAVHHVTGTTPITTIALPAKAVVVAGAQITLIADTTTVTLSTGGNIATAASITAGNAKSFVFDGTSWYPVS